MSTLAGLLIIVPKDLSVHEWEQLCPIQTDKYHLISKKKCAMKPRQGIGERWMYWTGCTLNKSIQTAS